MTKEKSRCPWCLSFDEYIRYHDTEWGVPIHDDRVHFEFLTLEGAQAGLSWSTILKKREGYRKAFANFEPEKVARFTPAKMERLMQDSSIVRNRLKIVATVTNAKIFLEVQKEFGSFDNYIWRFVNHKPLISHHHVLGSIKPTTAESDALSKDLLSRGFKFVGSTIVYAYMQACGLVNDHLTTCFRYTETRQLG